MNGYIGKILEVDLNTSRLADRSIDEKTARKFLGGKGLGLTIIYDELKPDVDPLGPDNIIVFATGPATGTSFPTGGRYHVMAMKSPLTGSIGSSNSGGRWGPLLKAAGYDAVVVRGASDAPVYLRIIDGEAELVDAPGLWGNTTFQATDEIVAEVGHNASVACIGPAGENLAAISCIVNDNYRAAGRTGMGAVMGSKKLKAIAVYGTENVTVARPDEMKEQVKSALQKLKENPVTGTGGGLQTYGTAVLVNVLNERGAYPVRNFQTGYFPDADKQSGETLAEKYLLGKKACWGCPIGCGRSTSVPDGAFSVTRGEGPEYETIFAFGSDCGITELDAIVKANHLCNELGLDTISTGATIACAMELVENGNIPESKLHGLNLAFGNAGAMVEAVWMTAYRAGIGDDLARGSRSLAEKYGAPELSMTVKGLELPAYDPRAVQGIGLNYATANRGGCHTSGYTISPEILGLPEKLDPHTTEGKAQWVKTFQDFTSVVNSSVVCLFNTFALGLPDYAGMLSCITGWDLSDQELLMIGERVTNLERLILNRYGFDEKDDTLPERLTSEPMPDGPASGQVSQLSLMLPEYYELRGWEHGKPGSEKLRELGLS
ncbi:MAG: Tungsten-containing aldehyde ferredoxin oxidoreductase [ANME-2 cluster archaeon]|nr:Tungsten-containing aldehyde ferredoxin oxidoreductase [ANME-2 cluster archaeon]